jgi:hypothetical protein
MNDVSIRDDKMLSCACLVTCCEEMVEKKSRDERKSLQQRRRGIEELGWDFEEVKKENLKQKMLRISSSHLFCSSSPRIIFWDAAK